VAIQKFQVPSDVLPAIWSDGKFYLRYRIITEDGAVASDWSNIYDINTDIDSFDGEFVSAGTYGVQVIRASGGEITIAASPTTDNLKMLLEWNPVRDVIFPNLKYDVFVKWAYDLVPTYDSDWTYAGTTSATSQYISTNTDISNNRATFVKIRLQVATQNKEISSTVFLSETSSSENISTTYVSDIDGGVI
jgi:hypothetical protein